MGIFLTEHELLQNLDPYPQKLQLPVTLRGRRPLWRRRRPGRARQTEIKGAALEPHEQAEVDRLRERDREVRTHEQAHAAAGGQHVRGGVQLEYATGPDGRRYAVGGEVSIDTSPVSGDPQATVLKAQAIRRAALAPSQPSGQDRSVAASASRMEAEARRDLLDQRTEGAASGGGEKAAGAEGALASGETEATEMPALGSSAAESPEAGIASSKSLAETVTPLEEASGIRVSVKPDEAAEEGPNVEGLASALKEKDDESGLPKPPKAPSAGPPQMRLDYSQTATQTGMLLDMAG